MKIRWTLALCASGVLAYMLTDIIHEVFGHGGTCLLIGHRIDFISSVYFRSHPGSWLTDIGGPLANLLFGILIYTFFIKGRPRPVYKSLFWLMLMAYNFFWFSGTILESGFSKTGDWVYAIKELIPGTFGKPVLLVAGIIAYLISVRIVRGSIHKVGELNAGAFRYAYIAALVAATVAGAFYSPDRTHAAFEGSLEAIGLLPILFVGSGKKANPDHDVSRWAVKFSLIVFFLFAVFCFTLGRGI